MKGARLLAGEPPRNDNARVVPGAVEKQGNGNTRDCAETEHKRIATATARAALLGIEARQIAPDAWLLRHARGADVGIVRGLPALDAAVSGFEAAHRDVAELVQRMRGRDEL